MAYMICNTHAYARRFVQASIVPCTALQRLQAALYTMDAAISKCVYTTDFDIDMHALIHAWTGKGT